MAHLRPSSLTDQIFIKANRIRTCKKSGSRRWARALLEFIGIVNYCFMAMIQCDLDGSAPLELPVDEANRLYHAAKDATRDLMQKKNHDYGEAWRDMRISSPTDLILMKVLRVKQSRTTTARPWSVKGWRPTTWTWPIMPFLVDIEFRRSSVNLQ